MPSPSVLETEAVAALAAADRRHKIPRRPMGHIQGAEAPASVCPSFIAMDSVDAFASPAVATARSKREYLCEFVRSSFHHVISRTTPLAYSISSLPKGKALATSEH